MTDAQHTPGPAEVAVNCKDMIVLGHRSKPGEPSRRRWATIGEEGQAPDGIDLANARRLALCWNACAMFETEALGAGIVADLVKSNDDCLECPGWDSHDLLREFLDCYDRDQVYPGPKVIKAARAAIAKKKGNGKPPGWIEGYLSAAKAEGVPE